MLPHVVVHLLFCLRLLLLFPLQVLLLFLLVIISNLIAFSIFVQIFVPFQRLCQLFVELAVIFEEQV